MGQTQGNIVEELEILVAEDSPTQAEQLCHYLALRGYRVTVAKNGKLALEAAMLNRPAMVITDVVMPEMDGYSLCREIKSRPLLRDVPVVLLTSLSRPQDIVKGLDCGADSFVRKPYDERYLLSRVENILTNRELRKTERLQVGVQLHFGGQAHFITAERQQILDLLISTYEEVVQINEELEASRRQLAVANQELEAFSYSVSHDLRAPLRHINGFARTLLEDFAAALPAEAQHSLNRICEGTAKMGRMVDDLLNLSRLDRHQLRLQMTPLKSTVETAIKELESECAGRKVEWHVSEMPFVNCDPGLIQQVFANLFSNAVKYTRGQEHTVIEVGTRTVDDQFVFSVRDNGAGFDPKYADKLFVPFQRLHRADEFEGTGIGLAIVQRIIRKHGGRIWAEAAVGTGATFYFALSAYENDKTVKHATAGT